MEGGVVAGKLMKDQRQRAQDAVWGSINCRVNQRAVFSVVVCCSKPKKTETVCLMANSLWYKVLAGCQSNHSTWCRYVLQ